MKFTNPFKRTDLSKSEDSSSVANMRARQAGAHAKRFVKENPITRLVNQWFDRVMGAVSEGSLSDQEEEYAPHRTKRDYVWNTVGVAAWGCVFPILTVVATQLAGVEQAGMFSMAFVAGTLLMILANFGVRTYQVSDVEEKHTFKDYQINRWITCVVMVAVGVLYCSVRGYGEEMFYISMGVYLYKMIDGLADVYEGRLQQVDKLYLAGISQAVRSIAALVVFSILLLITRNMVIASFGMAIAAAATFVVLTYPLTLLETPKSKLWSPGSVWALFKNCFPLFLALFLYAVIDNMPKFVMEGMLSYDNQLYFNALYFPAQGILLMVQLVYKPLLVRMANVWKDPAKRKKFDLIILGIFALIVVITLVNVGFMAWIGLPIMSFLYGIDFEPFRGLCYIMLAAGGITAAIDFLYQTITVLRRQGDVTKLYIVTFGFSLFIPILLVTFTGLPGAVIGYLIVMCILLVLLVWEYLRIRTKIKNEPFDDDAPRGGARAQANQSAYMQQMNQYDSVRQASQQAAPQQMYQQAAPQQQAYQQPPVQQTYQQPPTQQASSSRSSSYHAPQGQSLQGQPQQQARRRTPLHTKSSREDQNTPRIRRPRFRK